MYKTDFFGVLMGFFVCFVFWMYLLHSFFYLFRYTEVKTSGNFISRMALWILMEEIIYFPKPLEMQNGEELVLFFYK